MDCERPLVRVEVFILGLREGFRGANLVAELESKGFSTTVVWGIDGRKEQGPLTQSELERSLFFQNREISQTERACTLGHRKMHELASEVESDLYVFLEDDVTISNFMLFRDALEYISEFATKLLIWNLLYRDHNIFSLPWKGKFEKYFKKTYLIPTSTTGYVMNNKTLMQLKGIYNFKESHGYLADYPVFIADSIGFMASNSEILQLNDDESIVQSDRILSQVSKNRTFIQNISIFTCVSWLRKGREFSSLKAYLMHFHGRKIRHMMDKIFD